MKKLILILMMLSVVITTQSQNVGISDNSAFNPTYMLHVQPSATYASDLFSVQNNAGTYYFHVKLTGNVGIGTSTPSTNSLLDIMSNNKGVLFPRVTLASTINNSPVGSWENGLTVFNTATAGTAPNNVIPGYYYQLNSKWERIGGNQVVTSIYTSESTSDRFINSSSWLIYTGTPITITLSVGQKVLAWAQGGLMTDDNGDGIADAGRIVIDTRISVNGSDFVNGAWVRTSLDTYYGYIPFTASEVAGQYTATVSGSYTFQVETRRYSGGAGDNAIGGGDNTSSLQMTLFLIVIQ